MGEFAIFVIAVFVFVAVTIAKGVRIVPQGEEWIVERLGKYHTTLRPGLNIIIPYFDQVRYKLTTKDIILDVQEQEVITKDNAVILTNAIAFIKVTDPIKAVYGVTDFSEAIRNMIMTTLRSIIGETGPDVGTHHRLLETHFAARRLHAQGFHCPDQHSDLAECLIGLTRTRLAVVATEDPEPEHGHQYGSQGPQQDLCTECHVWRHQHGDPDQQGTEAEPDDEETGHHQFH